MIYYIIGMALSVLLDWYYYRKSKQGVVIESYPTEYLRMSNYKLFRSWVLWSLVWPVVFCMSCFTLIKGLKAK